MERSVQSYVASCEVCQKHKRRPGCQPGLLTPIPLPDTIFNTIGIDHVGPLPTTTAGNRYIVVAVDHLSKFVEVAAVPSLAAGFVIKFLRDRFEWKHGLPKKIISDRATTYRSRELRSYLRNAGVEHHFTSAYHPQANGLTERYNQNLLARLVPYCKNNKPNEADWDDHLQAAAYAINTAFQVSIGTSPYEVV
uniref:Tick transposon n=1 Tax=Rhipicephalus appendiculatus TaxID=34631 RepID=A0A131YNJ2_RHIAP